MIFFNSIKKWIKHIERLGKIQIKRLNGIQAKDPLRNISKKKIEFKTTGKNSHNSKNYFGNLINNKILPLPWFFWPKEGRLIMGLIAFWSISGIFILGSASWWVANREMGDGAYYIKRQIIWLSASWSIFYLAININLKKWLRISGPCLLIGMVLIGATSFFGSTVNGSTRWLIIGPLQCKTFWSMGKNKFRKKTFLVNYFCIYYFINYKTTKFKHSCFDRDIALDDRFSSRN